MHLLALLHIKFLLYIIFSINHVMCNVYHILKCCDYGVRFISEETFLKPNNKIKIKKDLIYESLT